MWRGHHRGIPICAVFEIFRLFAENVFGIRLDGASTLIHVVILGQGAVNRGCVNQSRVVWIKGDVRAFTTANSEVVAVANTASECPAGNGDRGVVLLSCVKPEGCLVVGYYAIKLSGRLIHDAGPRCAAIEGYGGSSIITINEVCTVLRVEPHVVVITVGRRSRFKCLTAVNRLHEWCVEYPDGICVLWVCFDVDVIPSTRPNDSLVVEQRPGFAIVVTAPQTTLINLGFDNRINAIGTAGRYIYPCLSDELGKAAAQLFPAIAPVRSLVKPTCCAT